jgi:hypothetical protein
VFYMLRARLSEIDIGASPPRFITETPVESHAMFCTGISPPSVDFGKVVVGAAATAIVAITNRCYLPHIKKPQTPNISAAVASPKGLESLHCRKT